MLVVMVAMCVSSDGNVNRSIQVIHRNTIVSTCEMCTLVVMTCNSLLSDSSSLVGVYMHFTENLTLPYPKIKTRCKQCSVWLTYCRVSRNEKVC